VLFDKLLPHILFEKNIYIYILALGMASALIAELLVKVSWQTDDTFKDSF